MSKKGLSSSLALLMGILIAALSLYPVFSPVFSQSGTMQIITAQQTANVRDTPSTSGARMGTLNAGDTAVVIGQDSNGEAVDGNALWYQIRLSDGTTGWVWSGVVTVAEVTPTPSPTPRPTLSPNPDYAPITADNIRNLEMVYQWGRGVIHRMAWSPDGSRLVVGTARGLWLYDTADFGAGAKLVYPIASEGDHLVTIMQLGFVGGNNRVWYMATQAGQIQFRLVDLDTGQDGELVATDETTLSMGLRPFFDGIPTQKADLSPDGQLLAISGENSVQLIQIEYDGPIKTRTTPQEPLNIPFRVGAVAFSPDGSTLAVGGDTSYSGNDKTQVYSIPDLTLLATINQGGTLLFSADSTHLAAGYGQFIVYNLVENRQERIVQSPTEMGLITHAALAPTADRMVMGYRFVNKGVYLFDTANSTQVGTFPGDTPYSAVAYQPNGQFLVGVSSDSGVLTVWDTTSNTVQFNDLYSAGSAWSGTFLWNANGAVLATRRGSQVMFYDPRDPTGTIQNQLNLPAWHLYGQLLLAPQANQVMIAGSIAVGYSWENRLQLLDTQGNPIADEVKIETLVKGGFASSSYTSYAFHPNGTLIAVGDINGNISLRDPITWQRQKTFSQNGEVVGNLTFSADGQYLVSSGENRHIWVWHSDGTLAHTLTMPPNGDFGDAQFISLSETGGRVAVGDGSTVYVFDTTTGELFWTLSRANHENLTDAALSPDGSLLAGATFLGEVYIYSVETQRIVKAITASRDTTAIGFSPDASLLLTAGRDGMLRFWGISRAILEQPPTATPTPSPTPAITSLFYDTFRDYDLDGWDLSYAGDVVEVKSVDGNPALHISGAQTDYISLGFTDISPNAKVLEADLRFVRAYGTTDGVINFNLASELPGHGEGYSALISLATSGIFLAERHDGFKPLAPTASIPIVIERGTWVHIRFEWVENTLSLYVDGVLAQQAEVDSNLSGVPLFILDKGLEVYLDNVRVE